MEEFLLDRSKVFIYLFIYRWFSKTVANFPPPHPPRQISNVFKKLKSPKTFPYISASCLCTNHDTLYLNRNYQYPLPPVIQVAYHNHYSYQHRASSTTKTSFTTTDSSNNHQLLPLTTTNTLYTVE